MIAMCVLYLMEKSRSGEVAIGGRGCHREIVSTRRSRDQEIAPTEGEVAIRRSLLRWYIGVSPRGRDQEIVSTRRSRDQEIEVAIRRSLLQQCAMVNVSGPGGGRDREIAPTAVRDGECVAIGRRGRDREIAPTAFSDNYLLKKTKRWSFPHRFAG